MAFSIGIDIGGSHVSGGIIDSNSGNLIQDSYRETPIDPLGPKEAILKTWTAFIQQLIDDHTEKQITKIGFAMPGPFDYENGIASFEGVPKYNSLKGVNIREHLKQNLVNPTDYSIQFMNDATAFALGEYNTGAAKGISRVWILTLGTGFGSTFLDNGTPRLDGPGMPEGGYFWYLPFKNGNADEHFSTRWFENTWNERTGQIIKKVKPFTEMVDAGDEKAEQLFKDFAQNLSDFLTPWIKSTDSKGIVVGGGIAKAWKYFGDQLEQMLKEEGCDIILKPGALGKYAPVVGAVAG